MTNQYNNSSELCMKLLKTAITVKTNTRISVTELLLGAKIKKCRNPIA